jgi:hypothetical protein
MELPRQLPERLLDFLVGRGFRDAQRGVVVFEFHTGSRLWFIVQGSNLEA